MKKKDFIKKINQFGQEGWRETTFIKYTYKDVVHLVQSIIDKNSGIDSLLVKHPQDSFTVIECDITTKIGIYKDYVVRLEVSVYELFFKLDLYKKNNGTLEYIMGLLGLENEDFLSALIEELETYCFIYLSPGFLRIENNNEKDNNFDPNYFKGKPIEKRLFGYY